MLMSYGQILTMTLDILHMPCSTPIFRDTSRRSAQPKLSQDALRRVLISAPDRATQERIAAVLASLDDKIESNRRLSHLLEQEVRLLFSQDFDVEPQASGKAIPEIVEVNPRRRLPNGSSGVYIDMASMPTETALIETVQRQPARSGQRSFLAMFSCARITPCLENGKVAFIDTVPRGEVGWGSTEFIVFRSKPPAPEEWAYCLVRSKPFIDFAVRNMSGTSGRQRCPASAFDSYRIQVPDAADLERFRAMAVPAFRRMGAARDESRTLAELREALLPELLSGRLRVPEADELVESVT
jgi:type I restriction enzyme S subunit